MKIVVLVKHVPDTDDPCFASDLTVDRAAVRGHLDEPDEYALEQAARIARDSAYAADTGASITAVTMGPAAAVQAVRRALILGADEGVHVLDEALRGSDALATARVLAATIQRLGFDLVLCGAASTDSGTSLVPTMVGDLLGVPALCFADAVNVFGDEAVIRREDACGDECVVEEIAATLPALVSVTQQCGAPHYPNVRDILDARRKPVRTWSLADLGIPADEVGLHAAATITRTVVPQTGRHAGSVVRDDVRGRAAVDLADFLAEHHLI
jgi:electron transfer flavoprotein beta subunit